MIPASINTAPFHVYLSTKCDDNNVTTNGISKSDGFLYEKIGNLLQPNYRSLPKLEADCHSNYINSNGGDLVLDLAQSSLLPANYKGQNKHNCQTISKRIKTGCSYSIAPQYLIFQQQIIKMQHLVLTSQNPLRGLLNKYKVL
jgi:hypothetical protein